jgi:hypothetical protein
MLGLVEILGEQADRAEGVILDPQDEDGGAVVVHVGLRVGQVNLVATAVYVLPPLAVSTKEGEAFDVGPGRLCRILPAAEQGAPGNGNGRAQSKGSVVVSTDSSDQGCSGGLPSCPARMGLLEQAVEGLLVHIAVLQ